MQVVDLTKALMIMCKLKKRYDMYISWITDVVTDVDGDAVDDNEWYNNLLEAAPYLQGEKFMQIVANGCGFLFFNTEKEMDKYFNMTVGDDGPTSVNSYNGTVRVYAITCDNKGNLMSENT